MQQRGKKTVVVHRDSANTYCTREWQKLYVKLSKRISSPEEAPSVYCEAKLADPLYQSAKLQVFKAIQRAGLGTWVKKPPEQDQFLLTL
ncbi:hypothetical protein GDO86_019657 [Hymenochirus boettgeri]|uniref:A to I editase domain-containing protein n=1 Tax=Hymenochirus boettgeri TaxID=247094 RepID=A0A8T2ICM0_9PIPI|nr:hypothetical protein GDO86_019657 [Hymenochirus boettgeri]